MGYEQNLKETYRDAATEDLVERLRAGSLTAVAQKLALEELTSRGESLNEMPSSEHPQNVSPTYSDVELKKKPESWKGVPLHFLAGLMAAKLPPTYSDAELKEKTESWKVVPLHCLGG